MHPLHETELHNMYLSVEVGNGECNSIVNRWFRVKSRWVNRDQPCGTVPALLPILASYFLLMLSLGSSRWWLKRFGPWHLHRRIQLSYQVLVAVWHWLCYCKSMGTRTPSFSLYPLSLSPPLPPSCPLPHLPFKSNQSEKPDPKKLGPYLVHGVRILENWIRNHENV